MGGACLLLPSNLSAISLEELRDLAPKEYQVLGPRLFEELYESLSARFDAPIVCQGRLSLTSGTPIPTSDVTAATTVYFMPYLGNNISIYNGSRWQTYKFSELSVAVPSIASRPFDIFIYDSSGVLTIEAVSWTNDTTRATALVTQDGVLVKSGATARRYLGTGRSTAVSGQSEDSTSSRLLWNMCNRVPRVFYVKANTDWNYTTATWHSVNADTTLGVTRAGLVAGVSREPISIEILLAGGSLNSSNVNIAMGIGINSTSANSADLYGGMSLDPTPYRPHLSGMYQGVLNAGYSYAQWLEISVATGTTTWYGPYDSGGNTREAGYLGEIWN